MYFSNVFNHCSQCCETYISVCISLSTSLLSSLDFFDDHFPQLVECMFWKCLSLRAVSKKSVASFTPGSAASFANVNRFHIFRIIGVPFSNRQMKETAVDLESENCEL